MSANNAPISVIIPVGPLPRHSEFLAAALSSINTQTLPPTEVIVVDNGAGIFDGGSFDCPCIDRVPNRIIRLENNAGIAGGFMAGINAAQTDLVFLLGSDDMLFPSCIDQCWSAWQRWEKKLGWYFVGVEYSNGFSQNTTCLAAMMPRELFAIAGPLKNDHAPYPSCENEFISRMLLADGRFGATYRVSDDVLYYYRIHTPGSVGIAP